MFEGCGGLLRVVQGLLRTVESCSRVVEDCWELLQHTCNWSQLVDNQSQLVRLTQFEQWLQLILVGLLVEQKTRKKSVELWLSTKKVL